MCSSQSTIRVRHTRHRSRLVRHLAMRRRAHQRHRATLRHVAIRDRRTRADASRRGTNGGEKGKRPGRQQSGRNGWARRRRPRHAARLGRALRSRALARGRRSGGPGQSQGGRTTPRRQSTPGAGATILRVRHPSHLAHRRRGTGGAGRAHDEPRLCGAGGQLLRRIHRCAGTWTRGRGSRGGVVHQKHRGHHRAGRWIRGRTEGSGASCMREAVCSRRGH
mmetsp:Transcript_10062/g.61119  ORF Transcript_10062/g.61119 Transcript_10062/m.61119 type:complete len:221 (+) Transcript_10062:4052-4714(+)